MAALFSRRQKCFCAFCKSERVVNTKRRVDVLNIFAAALGAFACMIVIWQQFDPKVFLIFTALLATAEAFLQIRWRLNIVCKECGFDPVLYVKDPARTVEKVQRTLERRKADPASLFKAPLKIPTIRKKPEEPLSVQALKRAKASASADKKGSLISKQI